MSELPPSPGESDEADALYRRASVHDAGRPSESVRRAVLEHAAQLAKNRAAEKGAARSGARRRTTRQSWRRPAAFGTLAAAVLAGILVIPQYLTPRAPVERASSAAPAPTPAAAPASPATPAPASSPAEPRNAARKEARSADAATTSVVEYAAKRMPAAGRNRQAAQDATSEPSAAGAPLAPAAQLKDPAAQLRQAAERGDVPALHALLGNLPADKQLALDARDAVGRTALMLATLHGRTQAVLILLSAGADPNAADASGTTPLQAALAANQPAIAAALRQAGAK